MRVLIIILCLFSSILLAQNNDSLYFQSYLKNGSLTEIFPGNEIESKDTNVIVAYINGVWHTYHSAMQRGKLIANKADHSVLLMYASCDQKNRKGRDLMKTLWIRYAPYYNNALIERLADTIVSSISAGKKFILIGHSKGGAIAYRSQRVILKKLREQNCADDSLQNLIIITLGGLSPAANRWRSEFKVYIVANNDDWVPHAGGNHDARFSFSYKKFREAHRFSSYLRRVEFGNFMKPELD